MLGGGLALGEIVIAYALEGLEGRNEEMVHEGWELGSIMEKVF